MQPKQPESHCLICSQIHHHQATNYFLFMCIAVLVLGAGLVWLVGQIAGLLSTGVWPDVGLSDLPGILARLPHHLSDPALAWPGDVQGDLLGPVGMYGTLVSVLAVPILLAGLAVWLYQPPPDCRRDSS
jgi:hypothetical protein